MKNKLLSLLMGISLFFFLFTLAVAVPIYCRFFYYIQIHTLHIEEYSGFDYATIKEAYDDILNYCSFFGGTPSTGTLPLSTEGAAHFTDCKVLFLLDALVLLATTILLAVLYILYRKKIFTPCRPLGRGVAFWSAVVALALPLIIGALASINFDKAFVIFHKIFFPGKDNWTFSWYADQVIRIMPQEFFMNCAIIIGVTLVASSVGIILYDCLKHKKK